MAELETGWKWWARYVIVPVLGGGSIIAVIIATLMNRPAATPVIQTNQPNQSAPANPSPNPNQTPDNTPRSAPKPRVVFTMLDEHDRRAADIAATQRDIVHFRWNVEHPKGKVYFVIAHGKEVRRLEVPRKGELSEQVRESSVFFLQDETGVLATLQVNRGQTPHPLADTEH